MILAAGLGKRLAPLSHLRAKPAMPVRGLPVISLLLRLLELHGVTEVIVNLHHLPETVRTAVERHGPEGVRVHYSEEPRLLGTGGGLKRAAAFLRESAPSLLISGDMLLDVDLSALVALHRERGDRATLLLRRDSRQETFGTIGVDEEGRVRRIARRFDLGGEHDQGLFLGVRVFAPEAFESLPALEEFEDLRDWLAPCLADGARDIGAWLVPQTECRWEPVGTPAEYLRANFDAPPLSFLDADRLASEAGASLSRNLVVGAGARIGDDVMLSRVVVWDGESIPSGFTARDGVYAGGAFHRCLDPSDAA